MIREILYNSTLFTGGDITGFVVSVYQDPMGQFFMGFVLLTIFGLMYIRTNSLLYSSVVWILLSFSLESVVPTAGYSIGKLFIVFGIAAGLYSLFTRSRMS